MLALPEKKKVPILMYHSISHDASPKFKPFAVSPELFAKHMAYLHEHGYTPITVTQFANALIQGGSALPERPVVLTFDDGFADFFTDALPVLERYSFTATLYVTTAFVNGTSCWLRREGEDQRPILTWDQLAEISMRGIECGGHGHYHHQLDILPHTKARDEIVHCKEILEDRLGRAVTSFAYPYGYHSTTTQRLVREAGYTSACAVKHAMSSTSTDPYALARLMVRADTDVDSFAALLTGHSLSVITMMYLRARTPAWQLARCSSALIRRYLQGGLLSNDRCNI